MISARKLLAHERESPRQAARGSAQGEVRRGAGDALLRAQEGFQGREQNALPRPAGSLLEEPRGSGPRQGPGGAGQGGWGSGER